MKPFFTSRIVREREILASLSILLPASPNKIVHQHPLTALTNKNDFQRPLNSNIFGRFASYIHLAKWNNISPTEFLWHWGDFISLRFCYLLEWGSMDHPRWDFPNWNSTQLSAETAPAWPTRFVQWDQLGSNEWTWHTWKIRGNVRDPSVTPQKRKDEYCSPFFMGNPIMDMLVFLGVNTWMCLEVRIHVYHIYLHGYLILTVN